MSLQNILKQSFAEIEPWREFSKDIESSPKEGVKMY